MAKQKVVLKLSMEDAKKRAKAMKCAVGMHGVLSVSHEGDKMTVVGEGIDSVTLTTLLRKKMGYVELEVVAVVEEKKEEKKEKEKEVKVEAKPVIFPYIHYGQSVGAITQPPYYYVDVREPSYDENNCSIISFPFSFLAFSHFRASARNSNTLLRASSVCSKTKGNISLSMAKKKVVLKLSMEDAKRRAKAMQCAVGLLASSKTEGNTTSSSSMAKQKVVLKLSMEDAKKRAKAMKCAVGMHGVLSVLHEGNKMTVVGEGIDSVTLTTLLRKKMGYVELEVVVVVEEKKKEEKNEKEKEVKVEAKPVILPYIHYGQSVGAITQPPYYYVDVREPSYDENNCSIINNKKIVSNETDVNCIPIYRFLLG
ncbi:hypothetical protein M5K25_026847 [Dendrobium thyrsiflorum]|uniref:Uncharacterized protein n=1 Tax=Dendrobium thyrsiflorum TaxID=117978 RepID=A0ABD0TYU5_DENTH